MTSDPTGFFVFSLALISAIAGHEFAHAWSADRLGDPTARLAGRVTLNPLAHLDPLGTLFLFIFSFGWGKPVPVDERHFASPTTDGIQVALAGPFANLTMAVMSGLILRLLPIGSGSLFAIFLETFISLNLALMIFNLIPIPPLDGSRILQIILPASMYLFIEQFGIVFLLILLVAGSSLIQEIFNYTVIPLSQILLG